jgi:hypothetical protein
MKKRKTKYKFTCDMCKNEPALYDAKTRMGCWAYLCNGCYCQWGIGLGLGKGQKLINEKVGELVCK